MTLHEGAELHTQHALAIGGVPVPRMVLPLSLSRKRKWN